MNNNKKMDSIIREFRIINLEIFSEFEYYWSVLDEREWYNTDYNKKHENIIQTLIKHETKNKENMWPVFSKLYGKKNKKWSQFWDALKLIFEYNDDISKELLMFRYILSSSAKKKQEDNKDVFKFYRTENLLSFLKLIYFLELNKNEYDIPEIISLEFAKDWSKYRNEAAHVPNQRIRANYRRMNILVGALLPFMEKLLKFVEIWEDQKCYFQQYTTGWKKMINSLKTKMDKIDKEIAST